MNKAEIINRYIKKLNGNIFKNFRVYSSSEEQFLLDRYLQVVNLLPNINSNKIGLDVGLHSSIFALSIKKIFSLNKLYALEHPVTTKKYLPQHLKLLKKNKIILNPTDLYQSSYPWSNTFFDFITFSEVLEHLIPAQVPHVFDEFHRLLKINGLLVITTPNVASLIKRINLLRGKNPIQLDLSWHDEATFGHIREYTRNELKEILKISGFEIITYKYFSIDRDRNIFLKLEYLLSKIFPSFSNQIFILAKKK